MEVPFVKINSCSDKCFDFCSFRRSMQLNITELRQITLELDQDSGKRPGGGEGKARESEQAACDVEFTRIISRCAPSNRPGLAWPQTHCCIRLRTLITWL